jgi:hypothetical protein
MARWSLGLRDAPGYYEKVGVHSRRHDEIVVESKFRRKMGERKSLGAPSLNYLQHFGSRDVEGFVSSDIEITRNIRGRYHCVRADIECTCEVNKLFCADFT